MLFPKIKQSEINKIIILDKKSLHIFFNKLKPYLIFKLKYKIADPQDREELIADILWAIIDSLPGYRRKSKFSTWVYSIIRHELADYYRKRKIKYLFFSHFPFLEDLIDKALSPQLALEEKDTKQKIKRTFKNLSEGYSQILRLRYVEGLGVDEIAKFLNISYKATESRLSRARLAFQQKFV